MCVETNYEGIYQAEFCTDRQLSKSIKQVKPSGEDVNGIRVRRFSYKLHAKTTTCIII